MTINEQLQSAFSLHSAGNLAGAAKVYQEILAAHPDQLDALRLLGLVFAGSGNLPQAERLVRRAVQVAPDFAAGYGSLGLLLGDMGRDEESLAACRQALKLDPNLVDAHCGLGIALSKKGDIDGAIASFRKAIGINKNALVAHARLGPLLVLKGDLPGSIHCHRMVCALQPNQPQSLIKLAYALAQVSFTEFDKGVKDDMLKCFLAPGVNHRDLSMVAVSILKLDPQIQPLLRAPEGSAGLLVSGTPGEDVLAALNDPLLLQLLQKCAVPDRQFEQVLTSIRTQLLTLIIGGGESALALLDQLRDFVYSLAQQCFFNEYVYAQTDEEAAAVEQLKTGVESLSGPPSDADRLSIAVYACFQPLRALPIAADLARNAANEPDPLFRALLTDQVANPLAELEIRSEIPSLVHVKDQITESVQSQYEENPFPRWRSCNAREAARLDVEIRHILPHVEVSRALNIEAPRILVAGCGTGLHAVNCSYAYKNARITAVDLSLNSLAYAKRMTAELGIDNIEYIHANILELDKKWDKFDLIESFGVLHHLSEPRRGWEILYGLLKKNGLLMLGLYSELARQGIVAARELIAKEGYSSSLEGIRACRQALFRSENKHIQESTVSPGANFWATSEVRDLVFHEMEYRYTIPELRRNIDELGFEFLGFQHQRPIERVLYAKQFPKDPNGLSLKNWHKYEKSNPRTFSNCYQFWLRK